MKKYALLIICLFPYISCSDSINDMLDELGVVDYPICVDAACADPNPDGNGWDKAYKTLADGVSAAKPGDTIWVRNGTYAYTTINKAVKIYGGFDASGKRRADNYDTVINGLTINGGAGNGTWIEGFTINKASTVSGAGVAPTLNNCRIANVTAGRGLTAKEGFNNLYITNSTFVNCSAGALEIIDDTNATLTTDSNVSISNSVFDSNSVSAMYGGAIYAHIGGTGTKNHVAITGCTFRANSCNSGGYGGAIWFQMGDIQITNCFFADNSADALSSGQAFGGALYFDVGTISTVINSIFYNNKVLGGSTPIVGGGAVTLNNGIHAFINSTFYYNRFESTNANSHGSAIYLNNGTANIYNTIIYGNGSEEIYINMGTIYLYNSYYPSSRVNPVSKLTNHTFGCIDSTANPFMSTTPTDANFLYPNGSAGVRDAGTVSSLPAGFVMPGNDLAGKPRIAGTGIDMGAYEWQ